MRYILFGVLALGLVIVLAVGGLGVIGLSSFSSGSANAQEVVALYKKDRSETRRRISRATNICLAEVSKEPVPDFYARFIGRVMNRSYEFMARNGAQSFEKSKELKKELIAFVRKEEPRLARRIFKLPPEKTKSIRKIARKLARDQFFLANCINTTVLKTAKV